jgi:hypothetical protein
MRERTNSWDCDHDRPRRRARKLQARTPRGAIQCIGCAHPQVAKELIVVTLPPVHDVDRLGRSRLRGSGVRNHSQMCDSRARNKNLPDQLSCLMDVITWAPCFFLLGRIMPTRLYRAEHCRDLAVEVAPSPALCAPSTEMQTNYSRTAEQHSKLTKAEEPGTRALRALAVSTIPASRMAFRAARVRSLFRDSTPRSAPLLKRHALC